MIVSPLFDFILASVADNEVGSASGVLNAMQQLAGAIGVAGIGTIFFSTLAHDGFVTAMSHCLLVELATIPVLLVLTMALPARAREHEPASAAADVERLGIAGSDAGRRRRDAVALLASG